MIKNVIFDLDDTLVLCNEYYRQIIDEVASHITVSTGLDNQKSKELITSINNFSITLPNGFGRERFPTTLQAAYTAACAITRTPILQEKSTHIFNIGDSVFGKPYSLLPGAINALREAKKNWGMFLWTKGDIGVQTSKIEKNNLFEFFPMTHCHVLPQKRKYELLEICLKHNLNPPETLMIGDSYPDDIQSAIDVDMPYIHIRNYPMPYWEDTLQDDGTFKTENLASILSEFASKMTIYS